MPRSHGYYRRDTDATLWNRFDSLAGRKRMTKSAAILAAVREWVGRHERDPLPDVPPPYVPGTPHPSAPRQELPPETPDPFAS